MSDPVDARFSRPVGTLPPSRHLHRLPHLRPPAQHPVGDAQHRLLVRGRATTPPAKRSRPDSGRARRVRLSAWTGSSCPRCCCWSRATCSCTIRCASWPGACCTSERWHGARLALVPAARAQRRRSTATRSRSLLARSPCSSPRRLRCARAGLAARARARAALLGLGAAVLVVLPRPWPGRDGLRDRAARTGRTAASSSSRWPSTGCSRARRPTAPTTRTACSASRRASPSFWRDYGGNPILRHHAYLPGTHLLMLPAYLACRAAARRVRPALRHAARVRLAAALLAFRFVRGGCRGLAAAAVVLVNPLVCWHQVFGANDVMVAGTRCWRSALAADRGSARLGGRAARASPARPSSSPGRTRRSCSRSCWAPRLPRPGRAARRWSRAARPLLAAAARLRWRSCCPCSPLDPRAFWGDIVAYNVGLAGATPTRWAARPASASRTSSSTSARCGRLTDHVSFRRFYLLLVPLGLLLLRRQMRDGTRPRRSSSAASRSSPRSTSRASSTRTTSSSRRSCCPSAVSRAGATRRSWPWPRCRCSRSRSSTRRTSCCARPGSRRSRTARPGSSVRWGRGRARISRPIRSGAIVSALDRRRRGAVAGDGGDPRIGRACTRRCWRWASRARS